MAKNVTVGAEPTADDAELAKVQLTVTSLSTEAEGEKLVERVTALAVVGTQGLDMTQPAHRDLLRSRSYQVARTKTAVDKRRKEMQAELQEKVKVINATCGKVVDKLQQLQDSIRAPLTEWEKIDDDAADLIERVRGLGQLFMGCTLHQLRERLDELREIREAGCEGSPERVTEFDTASAETEKVLRDAITAETERQQEEEKRRKEAEELAQLRAQLREEKRKREEKIVDDVADSLDALNRFDSSAPTVELVDDRLAQIDRIAAVEREISDDLKEAIATNCRFYRIKLKERRAALIEQAAQRAEAEARAKEEAERAKEEAEASARRAVVAAEAEKILAVVRTLATFDGDATVDELRERLPAVAAQQERADQLDDEELAEKVTNACMWTKQHITEGIDFRNERARIAEEKAEADRLAKEAAELAATEKARADQLAKEKADREAELEAQRIRETDRKHRKDVRAESIRLITDVLDRYRQDDDLTKAPAALFDAIEAGEIPHISITY